MFDNFKYTGDRERFTAKVTFFRQRRPAVNCQLTVTTSRSGTMSLPQPRPMIVTLLARTRTFDRPVHTRRSDVRELTPADSSAGRCRLEGRPGFARITVFRRLSHTHCACGTRFATNILMMRMYPKYARKPHY